MRFPPCPDGNYISVVVILFVPASSAQHRDAAKTCGHDDQRAQFRSHLSRLTRLIPIALPLFLNALIRSGCTPRVGGRESLPGWWTRSARRWCTAVRSVRTRCVVGPRVGSTFLAASNSILLSPGEIPEREVPFPCRALPRWGFNTLLLLCYLVAVCRGLIWSMCSGRV